MSAQIITFPKAKIEVPINRGAELLLAIAHRGGIEITPELISATNRVAQGRDDAEVEEVLSSDARLRGLFDAFKVARSRRPMHQ